MINFSLQNISKQSTVFHDTIESLLNIIFLRVKNLLTISCIFLAQLKQTDANGMLTILVNMC